MTDLQRARWLMRASWVAAALGVAVAIHGLLQVRSHSQRCRRKLEDLGTLRMLESHMEPYAAAERLLMEQGSGALASIGPLLKEAFPDGSTPEVRDTAEEGLPGWTLRRKELTFGDAALAGVAAFVRAAERQRPPWRLTEVEFEASRKPGTGRARIVIEALDRQ